MFEHRNGSSLQTAIDRLCAQDLTALSDEEAGELLVELCVAEELLAAERARYLAEIERRRARG